ncbi:MAG: hypothetical protein EP329_24870 [Deltaproteobacteria bacterium]|nr:MAG: hypothetical protein EP329_24870 [Deltaproteobacteria bacterium]
MAPRAAEATRYTFTELLRALSRGELDELEQALQRAAARTGATRDDAWVALSELWRFVEPGETRTAAEWTRAARTWLARPESRASLLAARGLRRADHIRARRDGVSCQQAKIERLATAWSGWHGEATVPERPAARPEVELGGRLVALVAAGDEHVATRALGMSVAGHDDDAIAVRLGVDDERIPALVSEGRSRLLEAVGPNAAFALRRVLGEDNAELARESGLAAAAVRMRVARGCRELADLVAAA